MVRGFEDEAATAMTPATAWNKTLRRTSGSKDYPQSRLGGFPEKAQRTAKVANRSKIPHHKANILATAMQIAKIVVYLHPKLHIIYNNNTAETIKPQGRGDKND